MESAEKINSRQQKEIRSNTSQMKERTTAKEKKHQWCWWISTRREVKNQRVTRRWLAGNGEAISKETMAEWMGRKEWQWRCWQERNYWRIWRDQYWYRRTGKRVWRRYTQNTSADWLRNDHCLEEHLQWCSVPDPAKIFLISKFSYLLFFQPHS